MGLLTEKLNPAVDKKILIALSGALWCIVGIMLCRMAFGWLSKADSGNVVWLGITGVIFSLLIYCLGFLRIVRRNIERINYKKDKLCIFAFQPLKSYLIVAVMITMGMILRHSKIPRPYLAVVYIGFGGAMFLSSIKYFQAFFKKNK